MSRLKQNEQITLIMTRDLQTITTQTPLSTVGKIFAESEFHHLPVVSGRKLVGIVSFVDLMRVNFEESFGVTARQAVYEVLDHTLTIDQIMTRRPITIASNQTVKEAAKVLSDGDFHALPVVNEQDELVGLVTSADLIKYLVDLY